MDHSMMAPCKITQYYDKTREIKCEMNRSVEQTNRPRTASRFTRFICPALLFIPHEPRKWHVLLIKWSIVAIQNLVKWNRRLSVLSSPYAHSDAKLWHPSQKQTKSTEPKWIVGCKPNKVLEWIVREICLSYLVTTKNCSRIRGSHVMSSNLLMYMSSSQSSRNLGHLIYRKTIVMTLIWK